MFEELEKYAKEKDEEEFEYEFNYKILSLKEIKDIVVPICKKYGVEKAYLFGSYARKEASNMSDVDLRIEASAIRTLFQLGGFSEDLKEALGKQVDIITKIPDDSVFSDFRNNLLTDEILLYDAHFCNGKDSVL